MNFGDALAGLKQGKRATRAGWNGKGMWLALYRPQPEMACSFVEPGGVMHTYQLAPFIAMKTADDKFVPWLASQTDVLAEDWDTFL